MGEGKGLGMVHERSAWYASDHRGVVVEFQGGE
jgi:endonuclease/exonuclease/phosphatase (EEP) superfamily protein YafD